MLRVVNICTYILIPKYLTELNATIEDMMYYMPTAIVYCLLNKIRNPKYPSFSSKTKKKNLKGLISHPISKSKYNTSLMTKSQQ